MTIQQAKLVIIGAGIVGSSAAYHLTKMGWRDVLVLDKGDLFENDGSTSHAPGGMHVTNSSKMMTKFATYSTELYGSLAPYEANRPPFRPVGGVEVAYTAERWEDLKRKMGHAAAYDVEAHLLTPQETLEHIPFMDASKILGSFYVPGDANVIGTHITACLRRDAEATGGATFQGHTPVIDFEVHSGHVTGVITPEGTIQCEQVLLCNNIWSPAISEKIGVSLPLMAAQHQYAVTSPLEPLTGETREIVHPILRHQDYSMYFRQHYDAYGIGNYRHKPMMVDPRDLGKTAMLPFTPEDFEVAWNAAIELLPPLADTTLTRSFNGMFAFTIDGAPIMGETPLSGVWTAVGVWITHAGGVGRAIAEWMTDGIPGMDLREADINRFLPHQLTRRYVNLRAAQNYREVYDVLHPLEQMEQPRNVRLAPYHDRLCDNGAVLFESAGYEVARWYEGNASLLEQYADQVPDRAGWAARYWSRIEGAEHLATRERVGLFNLAALAVIEVSGPGAETFLNSLAANRINKPVSKIIYTSLLDKRAGIVADLTMYRAAEDRWWVLTGGGLLPHDLEWIKRHAPADGSVQISDLYATYTTIGLWGPNAPAVLASITDSDLSFPYYSGRQIDVGVIPVTALRISYVGEAGWELYTSTEYAAGLWDALWEAGQAHGIVMVGSGAFDSLRLEKGYRLWGADIHTDYNPYEAGIGWAVRLKKDDFIGKDAAIAARSDGPTRKLCCMTLNQTLMGKEPIFTVDGDKLGYVTSTNYGYCVGSQIAYGYLPVSYAEPETQVEIEYFGERFAATVREEPLFDAEMTRLK